MESNRLFTTAIYGKKLQINIKKSPKEEVRRKKRGYPPTSTLGDGKNGCSLKTIYAYYIWKISVIL
ncbi:hypothetical protein D1839_12955 [Roseburia sp. 1XD42-34]|nr:hypothetical protein [Roseburia sp. 1XD42-34]